MCILFSPSHFKSWKEEIHNAVPSEFCYNLEIVQWQKYIKIKKMHQNGTDRQYTQTSMCASMWGRFGKSQSSTLNKCTLITLNKHCGRKDIHFIVGKEEIRLFHHQTCQHQLTFPLNPALFQLCCKFVRNCGQCTLLRFSPRHLTS